MEIKLGSQIYRTKELVFKDLYNAAELNHYLENGGEKGKNPVKEYELMAEFLIELFRDQFTMEDLKEKWPLKGCVSNFVEILNEVQRESTQEAQVKNDVAVEEN